MSRLTSKGQVTIPKNVRDELRMKPGDEVEFVKNGGEFIVRKQFDEAKFRAAIEEWHGKLGSLNGRTSDDIVREMRGD